jgi:chloramphenicol-sensitive protein RarD
METEQTQDVIGIWYSVMAYMAWGVLPLYWKLLNMVPALEILAHRILWSFLFVIILLLATGGWKTLRSTFNNKRDFLFVCLGGCFVSINWFTYIWAVNSNQVIEASMGYYINPLVVVLLGVTVLKEKLTRWQGVAIALAAMGVIVLTVQYGRVPIIALVLAGSFSIYGLIKKMIHVDPVTGLALETLIVMPAALIYILTKEVQGTGALGHISPWTTIILFGSGIATAAPLLLFSKGVQRIKFSTIGFLQYMTPTITLILGIFVFKEYFSVTHFISFGFIWAGLIIYLVSNIGALRGAGPRANDSPLLPMMAEVSPTVCQTGKHFLK